MSGTAVAIPEAPTPAEELAPGALSPYASSMVPVHRRQAGLPDRQEWTTLAGIANALAQSDMLPKGLSGRAKNVMAVILKGRDLGLSPTEAVWGIDMIEGMPTLKAHTMSALIKRAGHRLWYAETSRDRAVVCAERLERYGRDGEPVYGPTITVEWRIEDAIDAKLVSRDSNGKLVALSSQGNKPKPWMLYPAAMLRARALTAIARMEFSDVLMGAWYSPEELGAEVDGDGKVIRLPQGHEAVAAFESIMEGQRSEPEAQSSHPPQTAISEGEALSNMLDGDVIDVKAEPTPEPEPTPPPTRDELWAELNEQARVLAGGNLSRHTGRAVASYKANPEKWTDEQLGEFVASRRESYARHIEAHPDDAPAPAEVPTSNGQAKPEHREPYVGEGADGARRSAQMDREEADTLPVPGQDGYGVEVQDRRAALLTSADLWEAQADDLDPEPADDPAPAGTEPDDEQHPAVEPTDEPAEGSDTLI